VLVGHGEWVTVHVIARAKVALEIRGPEIIGVDGPDRHHAGMLVVTTPAALLDQPLARQEVPRRPDGREIDRPDDAARANSGACPSHSSGGGRRASQISIATSSEILRRHRRGARLRSPSPSTPALIESVQPLVSD
jgi:hypothetical protein